MDRQVNRRYYAETRRVADWRISDPLFVSRLSDPRSSIFVSHFRSADVRTRFRPLPRLLVFPASLLFITNLFVTGLVRTATQLVASPGDEWKWCACTLVTRNPALS